MDETGYTETEFYLVTNEDGNVTGDEDRDTALERMHDDYGGSALRVVVIKVKVPVAVPDQTATLTLPVTAPEPIDIKVD